MQNTNLPPAWFPLRYHKKQHEFWTSKCRFKALACGRGSGKTELCRRYIVRMLPVRKAWSDPIYFYATPTYNQSRRVVWDKIISLIPKDWIDTINLNNMVISTKFGSKLYVVGLDHPARIEGSQYDGCIVDESCDIKPGVFDRSILPALAHRTGFCYRVGVSKRYGIGAVEFKEFFDRGLDPKEADIASWTWPSEDILTKEEIALAKSVLGEADFQEQYNASWLSAGGSIFHAFDTERNIRSNILYDPRKPLLIGSDFNVNPMCWVLAHRYGRELHVFDEIFLRNTNTGKTLNHLWDRYSSHEAGFEFFGDASGRHKRTSAVTTDYIQIRNDNRFKPKAIYYPKKNPLILNRFASCNAMFMNAAGETRFYVHPKCKKLINDLTVLSYKEGTREVDAGLDLGHMADAVGYLVYKLFPMRGILSSDALARTGRVITA